MLRAAGFSLTALLLHGGRVSPPLVSSARIGQDESPTRAIRTLSLAWAPPHTGMTFSCQRFPLCIMEAVKMEYYSKGLILPEHLRAHPTSDMATSWACKTTSNFLHTGHRYIKMVSTSS